MSQTEKDYSVVELQARWDKIRIANASDVLDSMGYPNQCLDLAIRPIFPHMHLAGKAITVKGGREPRLNDELKEEERGFSAYLALKDLVFPGSVVIVECGGEKLTGKFGEITSWGLQQRGARGIVLDSYIRDWLGLEVIPDYTVCARGTSPIESNKRWRPARYGLTRATGLWADRMASWSFHRKSPWRLLSRPRTWRCESKVCGRTSPLACPLSRPSKSGGVPESKGYKL
jgi:regulator of RNase E activity RraA